MLSRQVAPLLRKLSVSWAANVRVMAMQPDDMLIQRAALALAHLMTASDDQEMNNLDRETIRTCAATAAGERDFRRLVVDCAQSWATTVEDGPTHPDRQAIPA
jgi:hypothetical protein